MVKFVPVELTLGLRSKILREDKPLEECRFPTDEVSGAFHLACYKGGEIASVTSFFPQDLTERTGAGYQLRGMATDTEFRGMGCGKAIIEFAVSYIKNTHVAYLWCNARAGAVKFYQNLGFEIISDQFEIPQIGPHYRMILNLE